MFLLYLQNIAELQATVDKLKLQLERFDWQLTTALTLCLHFLTAFDFLSLTLSARSSLIKVLMEWYDVRAMVGCLVW